MTAKKKQAGKKRGAKRKPAIEVELPPATSPARAKRIRSKLLAWYDAHKRDLPWRRSRDPYAIWISETMLQQTRVETVIPYYEKFLARFPDIEALATADRDDVYERWAGLGYYSRARNLHSAAQQMVADFESRVPDNAIDLEKLPGIGRYTAGAVASIAFERNEPVVDGNVIRVLTRLYDIRADVSAKPTLDRIWQEAELLARGHRPGDLNQALMEFGATLCTPKSPRCKQGCPLVRSCRAAAAKTVDSLPNKPKKQKQKRVEAVAVWIPRGDHVLAVQRPETGLLANLWELPGGDLALGKEPKDHVDEILREQVGLELVSPTYAGTVEHVFTHRHLQLHVFRARGGEGRFATCHYQAHRWIAPASFDALPLSTLARKSLELLR